MDIWNRKGRFDGQWHFVFVLVVLKIAGFPTSVDEHKPWWRPAGCRTFSLRHYAQFKQSEPVQSSSLPQSRFCFNPWEQSAFVSEVWHVTNRLTNQITPRGGLFCNLTVSKSVKNFPAFNLGRRLFTLFKTVCHLTLHLARLIQSTIFYPICLESIGTWSFHPRLGLFCVLSLSIQHRVHFSKRHG